MSACHNLKTSMYVGEKHDCVDGGGLCNLAHSDRAVGGGMHVYFASRHTNTSNTCLGPSEPLNRENPVVR